MALTDRDRTILDFERSWWTEPGPKDTAIRERFELSGTRYYQLLTELLDDPEALAQVPTIVLNGSGVKGAAKKYSDALAAAGYDLTNATGGNATANVAATQVLYTPGFATEAGAVAAAIGAPSASVKPIGTALPG